MTKDEKIRISFQRAEDSLDASNILKERELGLSTINRAYYAVFYAMTALLLDIDVTHKTHKGVLSSFHNEFIKNSIFERRYGELANQLRDMRNDADYDFESTFTLQEIDEATQIAKEFVVKVKDYLALH